MASLRLHPEGRLWAEPKPRESWVLRCAGRQGATFPDFPAQGAAFPLTLSPRHRRTRGVVGGGVLARKWCQHQLLCWEWAWGPFWKMPRAHRATENSVSLRKLPSRPHRSPCSCPLLRPGGSSLWELFPCVCSIVTSQTASQEINEISTLGTNRITNPAMKIYSVFHCD